MSESRHVEPKAKSARQRAREEIAHEILASARRRLTKEGPSELALRAVARDVGMVSSAVYRYFASRDDLLTALLVEGYNELGAAVEDADRGVSDRNDVGVRWLVACRAIRDWSLAHPGDYALLYGSPVPGYAAPRDTIDPATRVIRILVAIVIEAQEAVDIPPVAPVSAPAGLDEIISGALAFAHELNVPHQGLLEEVAVRTLMAWTTIFGTISFELFGHLVGSVDDYHAYFDQVVVRLAADLGFTVPVP